MQHRHLDCISSYVWFVWAQGSKGHPLGQTPFAAFLWVLLLCVVLLCSSGVYVLCACRVALYTVVKGTANFGRGQCLQNTVFALSRLPS